LGLGAGDPVTLLGTSDDGDADAGGLPATGSTPVRLGARRGPT
jgi:hypothetical protein